MLGTAVLPRRLSLNEVRSSELIVNHLDNTNEELSSSSLVKYSNSSVEELSQCSSPDEIHAVEIESVECPLSDRCAFYVNLFS